MKIYASAIAFLSLGASATAMDDTFGGITIGHGPEEGMTVPTVHATEQEGSCGAEQRLVLHDIRAVDRCRDDDDKGAAGIPLLRVAGETVTSYINMEGDGTMMESDYNPRTISNKVSKQDPNTPLNSKGCSDLLWGFGQFLDHDLDLTEAGGSPEVGTANIDVLDETDPMYGKCASDQMEFSRSHYTGTPRQQTNDVTACIDASGVYGSDAPRAEFLRTGVDGLLKTSDGGRMLPFNEDGLTNAGGTSNDMYAAGDIRANEQVGLLAFHTLFVREHNRLAKEIKDRYPCSTDEEIYQMARKLVGATIQIITYNEFLPALIGDRAPNLDDFDSYDPSVDPGISNEFSTAAYRLGHSMLSSEFHLESCTDGHQETILLEDAFFTPAFFKDSAQKVDWLLKGFSNRQCQEIDTQIIDDVRDKLFKEEGGCLDLGALNIQRGRDHGLLPYNALRQSLGLAAITDWNQITSNTELQDQLKLAYNNDINAIDAWVGGLAEDHEPNSMTGELFGHILQRQFSRLVRGDQYFYKWDASISDTPGLDAIWKAKDVTLATVIEDNTEGCAGTIDKAFFVPPESKNGPSPSPDKKTPAPTPTPAPGPGSSSGDPHFKTWAGQKYDYHGECDLVLVHNPSFADGLGLRVHIRTTRVKYFSFISEVAIQIGNDVLEFGNDVENFLINGSKVEKNKKHHKTRLAGFLVRRDPKAISIRLSDQKKGGPKIDLHARKNGFPAVIVDGGDSDIFEGSLGLLGDWTTGKLLARDGKTPLEVTDTGDEVALEWQVRDTEPMLFHEARYPQFPTTCTPAALRPQRLGNGSTTRSEAEDACAHWKEDKEDCIFDVLATQDILVAGEGHIIHVE